MTTRSAFLIGLASLALTSACTANAAGKAPMIPPRTLHCTLGHALDLDPAKDQSIADVHYEGAYRFSLFLPAMPMRQTPPPDPGDDPEPVDPSVRITEDPSGLASDMKTPFYRVADIWPHRVELVGTVEPSLSRIIIVSEIDLANRTANLFMTRAADAASLELDMVYQGGCIIETGEASARS